LQPAKKYQEGVFFIELHPPLGKLLIAAGEVMLDLNDPTPEEIENMVNTDYVEDFPDQYNFTGVRFMPSLLAFLSSYLAFLSFSLIFKNPHFAFAFSSLYLFNNAFIVHFRAAMLDGIQMFFILSSITYFLFAIQKSKLKLVDISVLTGFIALAVSTKINALILGVLVLTLGLRYAYQENLFQAIKSFTKKTRSKLELKKSSLVLTKTLLLSPLVSIFTFVSIFVGIQGVHFYLARNIVEDKNYDISSQFETRLRDGEFGVNYVIDGTLEWLRYSSQYNVNVPQLNEGNPKENGSYPADWLVGRKSISYRWDRYVVAKDDHNTYNPLVKPAEVSISDYNDSEEIRQNYDLVTRYVYLQVNPAVWLLSLLGLVVILAALVYGLLFMPEILKRLEIWLSLPFLAMYIFYFITVLQVDRVLYLYHSFIPITFGFYLLALGFKYWLSYIPYKFFQQPQTSYYLAFIIAAVVFFSYIFFAPFSYHLPMTDEEFKARRWVSFWELRTASEQENLPDE
jgi:dolichyl-phosphate-mannose-protein mannosyltransferase